MKFVFNHTTFDPDFDLGQKVLEAYAPRGIIPGKE
jgi:cytochrome oxidase Cu insertion factor (SCO1/SenC/PrrC family)